MTDTPLTLFFETFEMVSESHSETQNWQRPQRGRTSGAVLVLGVLHTAASPGR